MDAMTALSTFRTDIKAKGINTILEPERLDIAGVNLRLAPIIIKNRGRGHRELSISARLAAYGQGETIWQALLSAQDTLSRLSERAVSISEISYEIEEQEGGGSFVDTEENLPVYLADYIIKIIYRE